MSQNALRLSQIIRTFGPGSMVDLPTRSVIIGGLEEWEMRPDSYAILSEPRLQARLEWFLKKEGRLADTAHLTLRTPPVSIDAFGQDRSGVAASIFPTWFVCDLSETSADPDGPRRRRLAPWKELDTKQRRRFEFDDGKKSDVTPIRFVAACEKGHVQDIDWRWVVHGVDACHEPMWMEEKGTSADPADTSVVCKCGKRLSLQDAFRPGRLGRCVGNRPWLLDRDPASCGENLKLLTRTATNTYFPQVYTVISLPTAEDELTKLVDELSGEMAAVVTVEDLAQARRFNSKLGAALLGHSDAEVFERLSRLREGALADPRVPAKPAEFDIFASGRAEIGENLPTAKLYAQTLPRDTWARTGETADLATVQSLVAVHRLREVSSLYGFTRFEAAPSMADDEMEDIQLAVRGAPISRGADWLPAIELFGEGIFVRFDADAVGRWLASDGARKREAELIEGYDLWRRKFGDHAPKWPGLAYILLHSLSHALMAEIALDCGYPASSLKEQIYAEAATRGGPGVERCGILIYTATAGAQGTLGGLVATASRFAVTLEKALDGLAICSNDPVCVDHEPDGHSGDRATHGAACHGCLLISETSCEMRNLFLDRALLVSTMAANGAEFFAGPRFTERRESAAGGRET